MDKRPLLATLATVAFVLGLAWLAGFNFNERGGNALFVAWIAIAFGVAAYTFPFKDRK